MANILAALPKSANPGAKQAVAAFKLAYGAKFAKAVAEHSDDLDELLRFYD